MVGIGISATDMKAMIRETNSRVFRMSSNLTRMSTSIDSLGKTLKDIPFVTRNLEFEFNELFKMLNKVKAYSNTMEKVVNFYVDQAHSVADALRNT